MAEARRERKLARYRRWRTKSLDTPRVVQSEEERRLRKKARMIALQNKREAAKFCLRCPNPAAEERLHCRKCLDVQKAAVLARNARRRAAA